VGLLLGAFMLLAGVIALASRPGPNAMAWTWTGVVCGIVVGAFAAFDLVSERHRAVAALVARVSRQQHLPISRVHALVGSSVIRFSFRPGIYLALGAAALCLVAVAFLFVPGRPAGADYQAGGDPV